MSLTTSAMMLPGRPRTGRTEAVRSHCRPAQTTARPRPPTRFAHSDGVKGNLAQEGIPPLKSTLGDPQPRPMISSEGRSPTPSSPRRPRTCAPTSRICRTRRTRTRSPWIPSASHTTAKSPCTRPCSSGANRSRNMEKSKGFTVRYGRVPTRTMKGTSCKLLWSRRPHDRNPFIIRRARQSDIQP